MKIIIYSDRFLINLINPEQLEYYLFNFEVKYKHYYWSLFDFIIDDLFFLKSGLNDYIKNI